MTAAAIFKIFKPKQKIFYDLPEKMTMHILQMAMQLKAFAQSEDDSQRTVIMEEIRTLDKENIRIERQVFGELAINFITPYDREDIYQFTVALLEVGNYIFSCANKMYKYQLKDATYEFSMMAEIIIDSCRHLDTAIGGLRNKAVHEAAIFIAIRKIKELERLADDTFNMNLIKLSGNKYSGAEVIKATEIYQLMEIVTDKCHYTGNIIKSLIVKAT